MSDPTARNNALQQQTFDVWPDALRALFDGTSLAGKAGFTASLVTPGEGGRARTALLGIGELYAPGPRTLCIALWPQSRAAQALVAQGAAALTFVFDGAFYQTQFDFEPMHIAGEAAPPLACFKGTLAAGEVQRVNYARLTSGIRFELEDGMREAALHRWEEQIALLRRASEG
ncbi:hypothetical protein [Paraburkholderia kururiensis]|uniref:Vanillate decarboxylase VdcD protein n=1 Tax=Paraburkholderia kururiensis TaxID=984307 RepID=A0ABZ0WH43_9BURK|nr:hypothetical protein [Paraburkholderia kururiensis]WQD76640.1 hypothetical protein U0042_21485 [Paraburkholderia kururiensis]